MRPLSDGDAEAYYQDMLTAGELLGVRRDLAPADIAAFRAYMESSLPELEVTEDARSIADGLFAGRGLTRVGGWALREMTAALLPPDLAEAYGMRDSAIRHAIARAGGMASRAVLPRVPLSLRRTPRFLLPRARGR